MGSFPSGVPRSEASVETTTCTVKPAPGDNHRLAHSAASEPQQAGMRERRSGAVRRRLDDEDRLGLPVQPRMVVSPPARRRAPQRRASGPQRRSPAPRIAVSSSRGATSGTDRITCAARRESGRRSERPRAGGVDAHVPVASWRRVRRQARRLGFKRSGCAHPISAAHFRDLVAASVSGPRPAARPGGPPSGPRARRRCRRVPCGRLGRWTFGAGQVHGTSKPRCERYAGRRIACGAAARRAPRLAGATRDTGTRICNWAQPNKQMPGRFGPVPGSSSPKNAGPYQAAHGV